MNKITSAYLHQLQAKYWHLGDRGIRVDFERLNINKQKIKDQIKEQLKIPSQQWGTTVFVGASNDPGKGTDAVNLNATQGERALLQRMKDIGYHIPKITKKNEEGEYEQKYSTGELALQKMLLENQFNHPTGDPAIRAILKIRELGKILSVYLSSQLLPRCENEEWNYYFLSLYNVAGTLSQRRASRKHTFGFGGNAANFPKHSDVAHFFRECLVPRKGNIFLIVDQIQAEEWPVSALSMNTEALRELETNKLYDPLLRVDRHSELASKIFSENIPWKSNPAYNYEKHDKYRYMGKKTKHSRNYGVTAPRMADSLVQEGMYTPIEVCEAILKKAAEIDPSVDTVFHEYVKKELSDNHILKAPTGWERMFIGCRPNADNNSVFKEAYSWIPQHVVGANTGFALSELEDYPLEERAIVQEGHDSLIQDIPDSKSSILQYMERTRKSFERKFTFHNGIEIEIPIEAEIGYDLNTTVSLKNMDSAGLDAAYAKLNEKRAKKLAEEIVAA